MSGWFERYQQGFHQEVYDELLAMQELVFEKPVYQEALLVARAMMSRVRSNIALLIPRLKILNYELVDGDWTSYWEHEEVGSVNLIGTFPKTVARKELSYELDPLLILPMDCLLEQYSFATPKEWEEAHNEDGTFNLDLAVDADLKYNISGSGGYFIQTPCHAFDTTFDLLGYYHHAPSPTFINYLRTCFRWGGFFGLSAQNRPTLTSDELAFLTKDILEF